MIKKLSAYNAYLIFSGATALLFSLISTVMIVYHIQNVHLNPLQLILVGTTLEAACFIFEIPTGIVADIYSRKLSVLIGLLLMGIGFVLEGSIPKFAIILASQVIWGIGATFISGAVAAWIAEEEKGMDLDQVFMRGAQIGQITAIAGIILSTIAANYSVQLPIVMGGCLFILTALFLAVYMPENNFKPSAPEELSTHKKIVHTFMTGMKMIKGKPVVMLLLTVTLFSGLSSEGYDRLYTAHFLQDTILPRLGNLQPVTWFGIIGIAGMLISAAAMQIIMRQQEKDGKLNSAFVLLLTNIFYILCLVIFALTGSFKLMLATFLATKMFKTVNEPIYDAWLNKHIDDNARATVLSTNGQLNALGQIIGGPIIGIVALKASVSIGIASTAILLAPVVVLYVLCMIKDKK